MCNKLQDKLDETKTSGRDQDMPEHISGRDKDMPVDMSGRDQDIPVNMHHIVLVLAGHVRRVKSCERSVLVQLVSQLTWSWSWPGQQEEHTSLI